MLLRRIIWTIITFALTLNLSAQNPYNFRSFKIPANLAQITLDSLSIIEDSFEILGPYDAALNEAFYSIDYLSALLKLRVPEFWKEDSLLVTFSVFPINFTKPYFHKDTSWISLPGPGEQFRRLTSQNRNTDGLLDFPRINSSGSITRGVTVGNRQDLSLNSALNLQLSGYLSDEIEVLAVISDQDIALQPEGTTQQLQEFDKVFIQLSGYNATLVAGDFELDKPKGHFMNFSRKAQGGKLSYKSPEDTKNLPDNVDALDITLSGAVSKGIYARNSFNGMDGNQGPYKLSGNNSESYIIVLAGSERVFIDGELLVRGMENDYIIDYNQAEIAFTSKKMITANDRIIVEFEYAARDYARSMYFASAGLDSDFGNLRINFFSEQDLPNQPLFKELTDNQKDLLSLVGDSIHKAFTWSFDSIGFKNDRVMYLLKDTLGFDTVFVHSTNPELAHYNVNFTLLGEGKGNYRQISTSANGRVFEWIAPVGGEPQGTHEPVQLLVAPEKARMTTIAYDINISKNTSVGIEWAISNNDINLFSNLDKADNTGMAILANIKNVTNLKQNSNWKLFTTLTHETVNKNFNPIERYRSIEFERDWNISAQQQTEDEHISGISFALKNNDYGHIQYDVASLFNGENYTGIKNSLDIKLKKDKNSIYYTASLLNAKGWQLTDFYRHNTGYTRLFKHFNIGVNHQMENNKIHEPLNNSLKIQSSAFNQSELFISNSDTKENSYKIYYRFRKDYTPVINNLETATQANEYGASYAFNTNPNQRISFNAIYRMLEQKTRLDNNTQPDNSISGRAEYFSRWADGIVTSSLFYETASGMERKREYIYVEVPAGQGNYVWIDYNENGIMELDEFEIAQYQYEANFIRVFIPTDEFISVFTSIFSQVLNIDATQKWHKKTGFLKLLSRFSNQTTFSTNKKSISGSNLDAFNPFYTNISDTLITSLNTSLRNSLHFNRISPIFGMELTYRDELNKMLLSSGFETRQAELLTLSGRLNIKRQYALTLVLGKGMKSVGSDFFTSKNYKIRTYESEPALSILLTSKFRLGFFYGYQNKNNLIGQNNELAIIHKAGTDARMNFPGKGSVNVRFQISQIEFPFEENTSLAYDMLESLRPGTNQLWTISWQQNLNDYLMLILNYNGRKSPDTPAVHTGNVQVRAFF